MNQQPRERSTLRPQWLELHKHNLHPCEGIPAAVRNHGPLDDWETLRSPPTARLEDELRLAVMVAAAEYDHPLVKTCLGRACEIVAAGEQDERWNSLWRHTKHVDHGKFRSAATLLYAWHRDVEPDGRELLAAATEIQKGALEDRPVWTEIAQSEHLHGTELALIADELKLLAGLQTPKTFDRVHEYYAWLLRFIELAEKQATPATLQAYFDGYFDVIRAPFFRPPINDSSGKNLPGLPLLRLRLALIRWIYIERQPVAGNWRHIIGQIGY